MRTGDEVVYVTPEGARPATVANIESGGPTGRVLNLHCDGELLVRVPHVGAGGDVGWDWPPATLPFEPASVPVTDLPDALAAIDEVEDLHALQRADTRTTAAAHYERRINELTP